METRAVSQRKCSLWPGVVILMLDTRLEPAVAREMVQGAPDTLRSEFHLGYNMLLNLLRCEVKPSLLFGAYSLPELRATLAVARCSTCCAAMCSLSPAQGSSANQKKIHNTILLLSSAVQPSRKPFMWRPCIACLVLD